MDEKELNLSKAQKLADQRVSQRLAKKYQIPQEQAYLILRGLRDSLSQISWVIPLKKRTGYIYWPDNTNVTLSDILSPEVDELASDIDRFLGIVINLMNDSFCKNVYLSRGGVKRDFTKFIINEIWPAIVWTGRNRT